MFSYFTGKYYFFLFVVGFRCNILIIPSAREVWQEKLTCVDSNLTVLYSQTSGGDPGLTSDAFYIKSHANINPVIFIHSISSIISIDALSRYTNYPRSEIFSKTKIIIQDTDYLLFPGVTENSLDFINTCSFVNL